MNSERQIMDVPVDRGICCHVGGDIVFDSAGNLILSTGDDTNPFASDGFTPIDERPDRNPAFDAQRTAANTNDLRGKILRITPNAKSGGYTIPEGNLFEEGTEGTRPEIYAMGLRNPFRIEINAVNNEIYVGDYSPDSQVADPRARPRRPGEVDHRPRARQLRLAVLRNRGAALRRLRLRHRAIRRGVRLRGSRQRVAPQHRADRAAPGSAAGRLVLVRPVRGVP